MVTHYPYKFRDDVEEVYKYNTSGRYIILGSYADYGITAGMSYTEKCIKYHQFHEKNGDIL